MSTDQFLQQKQELKRPFNDMHIPSTESDSSSDEESVHIQCEAVPNKRGELVPLKSGEIVPDKAGEVVPLVSGEIVPLISGEIDADKSCEVSTKRVQVKNRRSKTKGTTDKTLRKKKRESDPEVSDAMAELKNFTKSLTEDFKVQTNKMLAKMKKDLKKLAAENSTKRAAGNSSKRKNDQTQELERTPSVLPLEQHRNYTSSTNCNVPAVAANNTAPNHARANSATLAITQHGFITNAQAPHTNIAQVQCRDISILYHDSIRTSVVSAGAPPSLHPSLDNISNISSLDPIVGSNPSRCNAIRRTMTVGAVSSQGSSLASPSLGANTLRSIVNSNEAILRMLGFRSGNFL